MNGITELAKLLKERENSDGYNPLTCAFLTFPCQWYLTIYNIPFILVAGVLIIITHNVFLIIGIAVPIYMHIFSKNSFDFFRIL